MTFLHKLAKRLATVPTIIVTAMSFLPACSPGTTQEYLGPDPGKLPPSTTLIGLSISPRDPEMAPGDSVRLSALGWVSSGSSVPAVVTWSASGGTISGTGWFKSSSLGSYRVRAVTAGSPSYSDSVLVTVRPSTGYPRLVVTPSAADLPAGTKQQFTAVHLVGDGTSQLPAVVWAANGGTITPAGLFTAAAGASSYRVTAYLAGGSLAGESGGTILPPVLTALVLDVPKVDLEASQSRQFLVSAEWSDGSGGVPALAWVASGGSISSTGNYTAGDTPGEYSVVVTSGKYARSDTSKVRILSRIVGIRVAPATALLSVGASLGFEALAVRNDGSERPLSVEWTAAGGTISSNGLYTAGSVPGQYQVVGSYRLSSTQVLSDTARIEVGAAPPPAATLTALTVLPDTSLQVGSSAQFRVAATWSDGSSTIPALKWSASGGSIDAAGRYRAGPAAGSYRVIASQQSGSKADTATVTLTAAPVITVEDFTIAPETGILAAGSTRQFSATLNWSDGESHPANISWVSAGGTITQNGLYTAGSVAGTFLIVATCSCGAADTASVTIPQAAPPAATLTQLVLNPSAVTIPKGATQQFVVTATWSDGSSTVPPLTFTPTGGTVTPAGLYSAGNTAGTYRLIVQHQGGTRADTSVITVPSAVTLSQLSLTPSTVTLAPGGTQQFVATGSWSDGSSVAPSVTWTATGGTISPSGLYTAGTATGTFRLIAVQTGGTRADTSAITVGSTAPPPTGSLGDLVVFPNPEIGFIVGPQVRSGSPSNPWPWYDENQNAKGLIHGGAFPSTPPYTRLTGTVSATAGSAGIVGAGTRFLSEAVVGEYFLATDAGGFRRAFLVQSIQDDTRLTLTAGWDGSSQGNMPAEKALSGPYDVYSLEHYYDLALVLYTAYYRTGNLQHLTNARKVADSWWLSHQIAEGKQLAVDDGIRGIAPRVVSLGGLMLRALDGRPEMWPWITSYVRDQYQTWVGARVTYSGLYYGVRDGGYMLLYAAWLAKAHPDPAVRAEFLAKARDGAVNYYARLQQPDGSWRWNDDLIAGSMMQPFMVGLLLDGLVAVHRLTGDAAVGNAVVRSVDNLYTDTYRKDQLVPGLSGVTWRGLWYTIYGTGCLTGCGTTALVGGNDTNSLREVRQLNSTIVHAFGYAYTITRDPKYRTMGDEVFAATYGRGRGPGADAYSGLADFRNKEFSAAYRSSGRYLAWRLGAP